MMRQRKVLQNEAEKIPRSPSMRRSVLIYGDDEELEKQKPSSIAKQSLESLNSLSFGSLILLGFMIGMVKLPSHAL